MFPACGRAAVLLLVATASAHDAVVLLQKTAHILTSTAASIEASALSEETYSRLARRRDDEQMKAFVMRLLAADGRGLCPGPEAIGALKGLVPFYSGSVDTQSLERLNQDLRTAPWVCPTSQSAQVSTVNLEAEPSDLARWEEELDRSLAQQPSQIPALAPSSQFPAPLYSQTSEIGSATSSSDSVSSWQAVLDGLVQPAQLPYTGVATPVVAEAAPYTGVATPVVAEAAPVATLSGLAAPVVTPIPTLTLTLAPRPAVYDTVGTTTTSSMLFHSFADGSFSMRNHDLSIDASDDTIAIDDTQSVPFDPEVTEFAPDQTISRTLDAEVDPAEPDQTSSPNLDAEVDPAEPDQTSSPNLDAEVTPTEPDQMISPTNDAEVTPAEPDESITPTFDVEVTVVSNASVDVGLNSAESGQTIAESNPNISDLIRENSDTDLLDNTSSGFVVASSGSNSCPTGYKNIGDAHTCRQAMIKLSLGKWDRKDSWETKPGGCHQSNDGLVSLNNNTGIGAAAYSPVCELDVEIDAVGLFEARDETENYQAVTIVAKNVDGTYVAELADGTSWNRVWPVHVRRKVNDDESGDTDSGLEETDLRKMLKDDVEAIAHRRADIKQALKEEDFAVHNHNDGEGVPSGILAAVRTAYKAAGASMHRVSQYLAPIPRAAPQPPGATTS